MSPWISRLRRLWQQITGRHDPVPAPPQPWSIPPEKLREGFDAIRAQIPISDEELRRARPVRSGAMSRPALPQS